MTGSMKQFDGENQAMTIDTLKLIANTHCGNKAFWLHHGSAKCDQLSINVFEIHVHWEPRLLENKEI